MNTPFATEAYLNASASRILVGTGPVRPAGNVPVRSSATDVHRRSTTARTRYAFLTLPDYSMIALVNAIEPLRMANRVSGQSAYEWLVVSSDGEPVAASTCSRLVDS